MKKDYYQILQVDPNADLEVLNGAYRVLVRQYHPDRGHTAQAKRHLHERMLEINEAYHVLQDAERRAQYDQARRAGQAAATSDWTIGQSPSSSIAHRLLDRLSPNKTRRLLLWTVITLLSARLLVPPVVGILLTKALFLFGALYLLFRFGFRRKTGN